MSEASSAKTGDACVQNPSDLDATYDGKKGQGYQAQFSETCSEDNDVQLIVSALPQTAVESDANALAPVLEDLQKRDLLPEEMLADTSYGSDGNEQLAAGLGIELVSPVSGPTTTTTPADQDANGSVAAKLTIDDFAVDERTGKVEGAAVDCLFCCCAAAAGNARLSAGSGSKRAHINVPMGRGHRSTCSEWDQECRIRKGKANKTSSFEAGATH